jgi:predicted regulator of Ras-like GTPase activity (Roadblock/LC7/MglB family)
MTRMQGTESGAAAPLPSRRQVPARHGPPAAPPMVVQSPYDAAAVQDELKSIRANVDHVYGLLLATRDGLVLAGDTHDVENDSVAAMAAASMGLAAQFTAQARVGEPKAAMFEGENGYVCVFPVETPLLLVVFGEPDMTMGLFNIAAKQALSLLQQALVRQRVHNARAARRTHFDTSENAGADEDQWSPARGQ